jgi:hypothetical protein
VTFTKLFASITESTIWLEDNETRIVWITMLAMANKNGYVFASEPGLANRARVPLEATIKALEKFMAPDKYSRSPEHEGRRIEKVDGGWRLLNYQKHRAIRDEEERREYQREWVKRKRSVDKNVDKCRQSRPRSTQAEAEAEADAERKPPPPTPSMPANAEANDVPHGTVLDLEEQVYAIANSNPKLSHIPAGRIPRAEAEAIAEAIVIDGFDLVLAGTRNLADAVARWTKHELRFVPSPMKFYREAQYRLDPGRWERTGGPSAPTKTQQRIINNRIALIEGVRLAQTDRPGGSDAGKRANARGDAFLVADVQGRD